MLKRHALRTKQFWMHRLRFPLCLILFLPSVTCLAATGNVEVSGMIRAGTEFAPPGFDAPGLTTAMALHEGARLLNGAHSRPLIYRAATGRTNMWVDGDWERIAQSGPDSKFGLAELGVGHNFGGIQANVAIGHSGTRYTLPLDGKLDHSGDHLLVEALLPLHGSLWGVLGGYYQWGSADTRRNYLGSSLPDSSTGSTGTRTWALRGRLEWDSAVALEELKISPYAELAYMHGHTNGYVEAGGSSPIAFDPHEEDSTLLRLGFHASKPINSTTQILGQLEGVHRFESKNADVTGEVIGQFRYVVHGYSSKQNWLRIGAGLESQFSSGVASLMLNYASSGEASNTWLAVGYRQSF